MFGCGICRLPQRMSLADLRCVGCGTLISKHLRSICSGWLLPEEAANVPHLGQMLAGAIIAPMLLELRMMSSTYTAKSDEGKHERASADVDLGQTDSQTAQLVADFFSYHNWGSSPAGSKRLTLNATGLFIVERCPAFGVCLSYRPAHGQRP